ncbi:hypothetical protein [Bdellovibrio svalbardensis]|uniref:Uncharacterized protein n=1 Tax=Bdellovibrio svalbardensis TaxID=2972972 RepID=A0ABT6DE67_9BACT|nr:hypothetical protein [Bdellovibrio svalbardensis]MDG0815130.1 hypothetical protein [Bdellovibrio svalbardensis]
MALKNKIFLAIAVSTLLGMASAKAYIVPGGTRPEPPPQGGIGPIPQPIPQQPNAPVPPPMPLPGDDGGGYNPYPGNGGGYPPGNGGGYGPGQGGGGYNDQEQRVIQVRRRIINEQLPLLQLAGIDRRYDGYTVQSIVVYVSGSGPRSDMSLVINGQRDASAVSPRGAVTLIPRYKAVLGRGQVNSIQLAISGGVDVDSIVLNLQPRNGGGYPPGNGGGGNWGREITVPLSVARRMLGNDRLDISPYIDMYQYRGMRITAIEIEAAALYQVAFIDVLINSFGQGPSVQIGNYIQRYTVYPQDAVIGQSAASIVLSTRGDMDIRGVTLRLSRR